LSQREELLDMAVHALAPLMRNRQQAAASDLFGDAVEIGRKLIAKVDETVAGNAEAPPRDELMDMGIHAYSALLNGRPSDSPDDLLDECMAVAQSLIAKVDATIEQGDAASDREELMDVAVHVQTAILSSRPRMAPDELSAQCVSVGQDLVARIDNDLGGSA